MKAAYEYLYKEIQQEMYSGNRHDARLRIGRLAGGYFESGSITATEEDNLRSLCLNYSNTPERCNREWDEAVLYGRKEPVTFRGSEYTGKGKDGAMTWTDTICEPKIEPKIEHEQENSDDYKIIDSNWIQDEEIPDPGENWNPVSDLKKYLSVVFEPDEYVGYAMQSFIPEGEDKLLPTKGSYSRTASKLIQQLEKYEGDTGFALGDHNPIAGSWIRFNPFDGKGVKDENVTVHRYALVESDDIPVARQYAIIKQLELPVVALVHSGGKSLHAIVHIDADNYEEYRERVNFLYKVCKKNGLEVDKKNRNPSRLSRMPGILRDGSKQFLVDTEIGLESWDEWKTHIEDVNDDLPDIEGSIEFDPDNEPELSPPIIHGLLRQGHKLLISASSKAGKSQALLQLCISCADGGEWFGWDVEKGKVLYVNLELDHKSCRHRIWEICKNRGKGHTKENMDIWNLRGHSPPLDKLVPKLIRRAMKKRYNMIVIDPLYKVLTGDENSAGDITRSFNEIDKLCTALNASLVVCHHHSKGEQWQKMSRDRSSGSGVFARDPDAVIDMIELNIDEERRKAISNRWECDSMIKAFDSALPEWKENISQDVLVAADKIALWAVNNGFDDVMRKSRYKAIEAASMATGWRVEDTLREFPFSPAKNHFYRYPVHVPDKDNLLKDAKAHGEQLKQQGGNNSTMTEEEIKERRISKKENKLKQFMLDFEQLAIMEEHGRVSIGDIMEKTGLSRNTVKQRIDDDCPLLERGFDGVIIKKSKLSDTDIL